MNATSSNAVTALDQAMAAALERLESSLAVAQSLRALDAGIDEVDDQLEPLVTDPDHQVGAIGARATLRGVDAAVHEAAIAAAALAANAGPMRDALVQARIWIEGLQPESHVVANAVAELTAAVSAMNDGLASLSDVTAALSEACDCVDHVRSPLLAAKLAAPSVANVIDSRQDLAWTFVPAGEGEVARVHLGAGERANPPQPPQAAKAAPVNLDLHLPQIPRLHDLPQELGRLVALFGDVRQAVGCVIGAVRASE